MGLIQLENMEFYAFHGHYMEERIVGNRFIVNLTIETDLVKPAGSDRLEETLNYQEVYQVVREEMLKESHLLEHIASRILDSLYANFKNIEKATIKISKMNPPLGGKVGCASITLTR